ncbi:MAG: VCBS repeat-containing protein [Bacteroidia bacterium]|nr:VCBS repeat-containing protein [Bacteroidia bacterium]MDW8159748.1 VCBS repeat-containing protein [Bacteroidia bacterium]
MCFFLLIEKNAFSQQTQLFTPLTAQQTGITFRNTSDAQVYKINPAIYTDFFNGGGIAVGDINNDNLPDILFTGNTTAPRLYLNLGNLQFQDITEKAKISLTGWATSAAIVDLNNDGYLDIFICRSGASDSTLLSNVVFINNRDLTFSEKTQELKLDQDKSYTLYAAFLDYDKDSDLDIYLVNAPDFEALKKSPPHLPQAFKAEIIRSKISPHEMMQLEGPRLKISFKGSDKLLRNDLEKGFVDVTALAQLPQETGMGLHAAIIDANNDSWPDIYVCNDFIGPDYLYINQKDGTFVDSAFYYFKQMSFSSMCADFGDLDNDGEPEALITEMLPYEPFREKAFISYYPIYYYEKIFTPIKKRLPQYLKNSLFRKVGGKWLAEVAHYTNLARTDWSWSALIADFNNDAWQDIFISTGMAVEFNYLDFYTYQNNPNQKFQRYQKQEDLIYSLPRNPQPNFLFLNQKNFQFENAGNQNGLAWKGITPAATYADLDRDGDLDLIYNNQDTTAFILRNNVRENSQNPFFTITFEKKDFIQSLGAKIYLKAKDLWQFREVSISKGYQASTENIAHFGLPPQTTNIDSLLILFADNKFLLFTNLKSNQIFKAKYAEAQLWQNKSLYATIFKKEPFFKKASLIHEYKHQENPFIDFETERLLLKKYSCQGPGISVEDINQDGLEDIFLGNGAGHAPMIWLQQPNGNFIPSLQPGWQNEFYQDAVGSIFVDYDNDNDKDILLFFAGNETPVEKPNNYRIRLYKNLGKGQYLEDTTSLPIQLPTTCIAASDYNKDGFIDLFIGASVLPSNWPLAKGSLLLKNNKGTFEPQTQLSWLDTLGIITNALFSDIDNDGWQDLIIVGEGTPIYFIKNEQGTLKPIRTNLEPIHGFWQSITAADFDNDGDIDYVVGNVGNNHRYSASLQKPITIVVQDLDKNGKIDPLTFFYDRGQQVSLFNRDLICEQVPAFRNQFLTYADFGKAKLQDFFKVFPYQPQKVITIHTLSSIYLENLGNFQFRSTPLPFQAQLFPIKGMLACDINQDAWLDLLIIGNEYNTHPNFGRQDAGNSLVLLGQGNGNFTAQENTGFWVSSDARALTKIKIKNLPCFLASANQDSLFFFTLHKPQNYFYFEFIPNEAYAHIYFKGSTQPRKLENIPVTSYLSYSSSSSFLNKNLIEKIITFNSTHQHVRTIKP